MKKHQIPVSILTKYGVTVKGVKNSVTLSIQGLPANDECMYKEPWETE